jgi:hypothetical protein
VDLPARIGTYEPLMRLASGGMASLYIARHAGAGGFERLVVIKRVHRHLLGNREFCESTRPPFCHTRGMQPALRWAHALEGLGQSCAR